MDLLYFKIWQCLSINGASSWWDAGFTNPRTRLCVQPPNSHQQNLVPGFGNALFFTVPKAGKVAIRFHAVGGQSVVHQMVGFSTLVGVVNNILLLLPIYLGTRHRRPGRRTFEWAMDMS